MTLEDRIDRLEDAHRALAAQHTALMQVCRVMLPLIAADPAMVSRMLLAAYDSSNEHMDTDGMDDEYQALLREAIDLLSEPILAAANIRARRPSEP